MPNEMPASANRWSIAFRMGPVASPDTLPHPSICANRKALPRSLSSTMVAGVIRHAADPRRVEFAARPFKQLRLWMREQHVLSTRHLDLVDVQRLQLANHGLQREAVISERANSYTQWNRAPQLHGARNRHRLRKLPARHRHSGFGAGRGATSASTRPMAH